MHPDKLQTALENLLAAKDAVPAEPTPEVKEEHVVALEDFVSSSG